MSKYKLSVLLKETITSAIEEVVREISTEMDFILLVPNDSRWEFKDGDDDSFDDSLNHPPLVLSIKNWSREEFDYNRTGVKIKTAFGKKEVYAFFYWYEILAVMDSEFNIIIGKGFDKKHIETQPEQSEQPKHNLKDLMKQRDNFDSNSGKNNV